MTMRVGESSKKIKPPRGTGGRPMMPGPWELIIILLIIVMVFGAKRIPEIMGGIGKGRKTFKKTMEDDEPVSISSEQAASEPKEISKAEKPGS
jgi:sec-independent protein translocase protein TatA